MSDDTSFLVECRSCRNDFISEYFIDVCMKCREREKKGKYKDFRYGSYILYEILRRNNIEVGENYFRSMKRDRSIDYDEIIKAII